MFALQMAYILAVNAAIIGETGGPCTVADCTVSRHCNIYAGIDDCWQMLAANFPLGCTAFGAN